MPSPGLGYNPPLLQQVVTKMHYPINEIFQTIQGEGVFTGLPATEDHDGFFHVFHSSGQLNGGGLVQSHATAGSNG